MEQRGILVIEGDEASRNALGESLGAEGWVVHRAADSRQAFRELATGQWTLIIANLGTVGLFSPLYQTLRELGMAQDSDKVHVRVLFLVPEELIAHSASLEKDCLSFVLKPFNFHDLLEKVSDLLMETEAISSPIRQVRQDSTSSRRRLRHGSRTDRGRDLGRNTGMFANREDYEMTEEELAEYERHETLEEQRKKKKKTFLD